MKTSQWVSAACFLLLTLMVSNNQAWPFSSDKCSGQHYDEDTHICCDDHLFKRPDGWPVILCCKDQMYNVATHICCGWERVATREWARTHGDECYHRDVVPNADD